MIDYEELRFNWWLLDGILLNGLAVTDGLDMGGGMLTRFLGRNEPERRILINPCPLYPFAAADLRPSVDVGGSGSVNDETRLMGRAHIHIEPGRRATECHMRRMRCDVEKKVNECGYLLI